jgi:hypothetical protein
MLATSQAATRVAITATPAPKAESTGPRRNRRSTRLEWLPSTRPRPPTRPAMPNITTAASSVLPTVL